MNNKPSTPSSFLPEDYLQRKSEARANTLNLLLFGIVLFGVIGAFFVTNRRWASVRTEQAEINREYTAETQKIEQLKVLEGQKREMLEKAEITAALIEKVPRSILLAEVINRMPEKLTLTELSIQSKRIKDEPKKPANATAQPKSLSANPSARTVAGKGKPGEPPKAEDAPRPRPPKMEFTLVLTGLSATDTEVADYQTALKGCPLLEKCELVSSAEMKVDKTDGIKMRKFRIEAQIRADADARRIEPLQVPRLKTGLFTERPSTPDPARQAKGAANADIAR